MKELTMNQIGDRVGYLNEWIPVTECLPKTAEWPEWTNCLVTIESKYGNYVISTHWADGWNCSMDYEGNIDRTYEIKGVVAWMPLPLPYETEEQEG